MATPELRFASEADLDPVLELVDEYHHQGGLTRHSKPRNRAVLEEVLENPRKGKILIAESEGEVLGYALVTRRMSFEWASEVAVLDEIFIQGRARERGLGRRMISKIEDYVASEGLPNIVLEVSVHNVQAREFYRSIGFQRADREIYSRPVRGSR